MRHDVLTLLEAYAHEVMPPAYVPVPANNTTMQAAVHYSATPPPRNMPTPEPMWRGSDMPTPIRDPYHPDDPSYRDL